MIRSLVVVDCNYLCYRAHYTTGPLEYKGQPTGVIFGFLNQLAMIGQTLMPDNIAFTWDSRRSIRKQKYPFYKDNRKKDPPDQFMLQAYGQFNVLRDQLITTLGFQNNFVQEGYEADDIMAHICQNPPVPITLTTSDDDMLQVLSPQVKIYNLGRKELMDHKTFRKQYGIRSSRWVEVKQIAGCSGDNVPGIQGVKEKTAIKYLTGQLKETTKAYQAITSPEGQQIIERNEWLVKLPLPGTEPVTIQPNRFDKRQLIEICKQYGFRKWLNTQWLEDWEIYFG